jgi:hypothetical protein
VAAATAPLPPLTLPRPQGLWYALALLLSLVLPVAGFTLALFYARQEDRSARIFGYICLGLAVAGWMLSIMTGAVKTAMGSGEWFVQPYY